MSDSPESSFLDGRSARFAALAVLLAVAALLLRIHWADLFPPPEAERAADDPVALCMAERVAGIEAMQRDGTITADQAQLFSVRAEALCQAQQGGGSAPPPLN